jgi:hypothetical protein
MYRNPFDVINEDTSLPSIVSQMRSHFDTHYSPSMAVRRPVNVVTPIPRDAPHEPITSNTSVAPTTTVPAHAPHQPRIVHLDMDNVREETAGGSKRDSMMIGDRQAIKSFLLRKLPTLPTFGGHHQQKSCDTAG